MTHTPRVLTAVRIPEDLHQAVRDRAEHEERSMNSVIVRLIRDALANSRDGQS